MCTAVTSVYSFRICSLLKFLAAMSFAWFLYDRIIDLSDVFANHFNNLLAFGLSGRNDLTRSR